MRTVADTGRMMVVMMMRPGRRYLLLVVIGPGSTAETHFDWKKLNSEVRLVALHGRSDTDIYNECGTNRRSTRAISLMGLVCSVVAFLCFGGVFSFLQRKAGRS